MIRCYLSKFMGENKLKISDLERATGLHRNSITLLYNEKASRVELKTIEKLCKHFHCEISDLFEYIPDEAEKIK